jgi:hypothetical protein
VLCLIVVPLPPGKNPFAVKINNNNNNECFCWKTDIYTASVLHVSLCCKVHESDVGG